MTATSASGRPAASRKVLLCGGALQKQQSDTLPPLEQWYVMLLHNGAIAGALVGRLNTASTRRLMEDAKAKVPRLRYDLSDVTLRDFLLDEHRIGTKCKKYRNAGFNGWAFPPLAEAREGWERCYGPTEWDHAEVVEWVKEPGLLDQVY